MGRARCHTFSSTPIGSLARTMQRAAWHLLIGLLLAIGLFAATAQNAGAASTTVHVRAQVLPWLKVAATPRVASYQVDQADLERGYIDLPRSLTINLSTNLRQDILLDLQSFGPEQIKVLSPSGSGIGTVRIAAIGNSEPIHREVDLRILLPEGMQAGSYPFQVNVSALDI